MPLEFDDELPAWNYRAVPGAANDLILKQHLPVLRSTD